MIRGYFTHEGQKAGPSVRLRLLHTDDLALRVTNHAGDRHGPIDGDSDSSDVESMSDVVVFTA